jgi:hypothetical protein
MPRMTPRGATVRRLNRGASRAKRNSVASAQPAEYGVDVDE